MGKKLLTTPRSRVKAALRQVWLRSRERAAALKREAAIKRLRRAEKERLLAS